MARPPFLATSGALSQAITASTSTSSVTSARAVAHSVVIGTQMVQTMEPPTTMLTTVTLVTWHRHTLILTEMPESMKVTLTWTSLVTSPSLVDPLSFTRRWMTLAEVEMQVQLLQATLVLASLAALSA